MLSAFLQPLAGAYPFGRASAETRRLAAIARYAVDDVGFAEAFDPIAALAARLFETPLALISLVEANRIRLIGSYGFNGTRELPSEPGLCASAIDQHVPYVVEQADVDARTRAHSLVVGSENVRFYAAVSLRAPSGSNVGTLAVLDRIARHADRGGVALLETLAALTVDRLERRAAARSGPASAP